MVQHASCEKKKKKKKKTCENAFKIPLGKVNFNWYNKFGMNKIVENDNNYVINVLLHST